MDNPYIVDITKSPLGPPNREYVITLFGERETIDSRINYAEYEQYIKAYYYAQAMEERKNRRKNERKNG